MKRYFGVAAVAAICAILVSGSIQSLVSAYAVQNPWIPPTSGIYTGPQFSQLIGDAFRSVASGNKGATAPATVGGSAVDGLPWIDDTTSVWLKKRYINGGWATEGAYDSISSSWVGIIGGGAPVSLASSSTVDLGSVPQANVTITGTTAVTSFGASAAPGVIKIIRFDGALTLTHSSGLTIPCGFSITTAANDRAIVTHLGSGNWEVTQYTRDSGIPIDCSAVSEIKYGSYASVPDLHVRGYGQALLRSSYPSYLARVTRAQNGTRTSGNATIASVANTDGLGAGMPVEGAGIGAGCTIASVVANTSITLNSSACVTSSGTSTVTVFLTGYGAAGTSSHVGVVDCRGRSMAGRDHTTGGASLASRLTTSYFGSNSAIMNIANGSESQTLTTAQMPVHSHGITDPGHFHNIVNIPRASSTTVGSVLYFGSVNVGNQSLISDTQFTGITINNAGSGAAHPIVPPTLIAECIVRVTP